MTNNDLNYYYSELYETCCDIITQSNDRNILNKKCKLDKAYKQLHEVICEIDNIELKDEKLQDFYSVIFELKLYKFIKDNGSYIIANDDNKGGPDFDCDIGYVECVTATKGQKGASTRSFVDKNLGEEYGYGIPQFSMGDEFKYKAIIPRISSVIRDKKRNMKII